MLQIYSLPVIRHIPWLSSVKLLIYFCPGKFILQSWQPVPYWRALEKYLLVFPEQLGKQKKIIWGGQYSSGDLLLPFTPTVTSLRCMMYTLWNSTAEFWGEEDEGEERAAGTFSSGLGLPSSTGATSSLVVPKCLSRKKVTLNEHMAFSNCTTI